MLPKDGHGSDEDGGTIENSSIQRSAEKRNPALQLSFTAEGSICILIYLTHVKSCGTHKLKISTFWAELVVELSFLSLDSSSNPYSCRSSSLCLYHPSFRLPPYPCPSLGNYHQSFLNRSRSFLGGRRRTLCLSPSMKPFLCAFLTSFCVVHS